MRTPTALAPRSPFLWFVALVLAAAAAAQACTSSSSGGNGSSCADNPNSCGAGTTCWPSDCSDPKTCIPKMACLPSAPNKSPHDLCNNTVGTPTCSDHQACVEFQAGRGGCLTYCDESKPNHGCPDIESCTEATVGPLDAGAPVIHVCAVVEPDSGSSSGTSGGSDSGARDVFSERPM
jgi:hypothetical protein